MVRAFAGDSTITSRRTRPPLLAAGLARRVDRVALAASVVTAHAVLRFLDAVERVVVTDADEVQSAHVSR